MALKATSPKVERRENSKYFESHKVSRAANSQNKKAR